MGKAVDRLIAVKRIKEKVDETYKKCELDAEVELGRLNAETGTTEIGSMLFEGAGVYKYSKTRAKRIQKYALDDESDLAEWVSQNPSAVAKWLASKAGRDSIYAEQFGAWWFSLTGEVPDGMTRTEYEEPPRIGAPKVYQYDPLAIDAYFEENGGWLEGGSRLLLGDGE